jgi:1A family penicillin-binding protein
MRRPSRTRRTDPRQGKPGAPSRRVVLPGWAIPGGVAGLLAVLGAGSLLWLSCGFQGCPDPAGLGVYQPGGAPVLLDRHGEPFADLHPLETRTIALDALPAHVPAAFIAAEDRRFRSHRGVDWRRVLGAAVRNASAGEVRQGASTLTMQLARTLFPEVIPGAERTTRRKLLEIRTAGRIERHFSKDEILELYLNHVYVGAGAYGIEAGARHYFDRPATDLTPAEAALMAAILPAPAHFHPRRNPGVATLRRDRVLAQMAREGALSEAEHLAARSEPAAVVDRPALHASLGLASFFVESIRSQLEELLGEALYRDRLRIHTTLDRELQRAAEEELARQLERIEAGAFGTFNPGTPSDDGGVTGSPHLQGAVVFLDPATGDVRAYVGGRDFAASRFDRVLHGRRQMGSAFKPFVYAAALERGFVASQPIADAPFRLTATDGSTWSPGNHDGSFRGPVTLRRALVESLNVPTVRLALATGLEAMTATAARAGLPEPVPSLPAAALGTSGATPLELAGAYAGLAAGGMRPLPRTVVRVETVEGEVIHAWDPVREEGLDPAVTRLLTELLEGVISHGTGRGVRSAGYSGLAAGKTGTTQNAQDLWFAGYTPHLAGVVWIGFDRPRPVFRGATGGGVAAPVWGAILARVEGDAMAGGWPSSGTLVERTIDPSTGQVLADGCAAVQGERTTERFLAAAVPASTCPEPPGIRERLGGFLRGLFGRSSPGRRNMSAESAPGSEGIQILAPGLDVESLLGHPRVRLRSEP